MDGSIINESAVVVPIGVSNGVTLPESIEVLVRVRPLTANERDYDLGSDSVVDIKSEQSLGVTNSDGRRSFQCTYDAVFGPESTQTDIYECVRGCTESVLDGINSTIFAYGQTGSGKTFSMYGPPADDGSSYRSIPKNPELVGVIPRVIKEIFETAKKDNVLTMAVYCSFVQIYNEQLFDMLRDASMMQPLTIREDKNEIYVQGLSEYHVKNVHDTMQLLRIAEENRAIRETHMNQFSSRSHSIFQLYVEQKLVADDGGEVSLRAKYNLVDLAGSEKWNLGKQMMSEHVAEMNNINLSLTTLGMCISSLAKKSMGKDAHVPYRDSKLTRLLQDSLGGNAKTVLIATISPSRSNADESISTLKFADRAKQVMVRAVVNETRPVDYAMVQRLQKEVEHLRGLLRQYSEGNIPPVIDQSNALITHVLSDTQVANSSSSSNQIIATLQQSLFQEKERSLALGNENSLLKRENHSLVKRSTHFESKLQQLQQLQQQQGNNNDEKTRQQSIEINKNYESIILQNNRMWELIDNVQKVMKKFFKFEIEEDHMKQQTEHIFQSFQALRLDAPVLKQISNNEISNNYLRNSHGGRIHNNNDKTGENNINAINVEENRKPKGKMFADPKQLPSIGGAQWNYDNDQIADSNSNNRLQPQPPNMQHSNSSSEVSGRGRNKHRYDSSNVNASLNSLDFGINKDAPRQNGNINGQAALPQLNVGSQPNRFGRQLNLANPLQYSPTKSETNMDPAQAAAFATGVSFRVREQKKGEFQGGWMAPPTEEEEEARLQRELKKSKKKLKKQMQLQEWIREKEERTMTQVKAEEEERRAMQEAEAMREQKRKEYARKQKLKIQGYQERIKSEAEQIQELIALGIDPTSLM